MSTIRNPVGPQPNKVYWRRRLVVLIGVLAVIAIVILIVARPGSAKPKAAPTNTAHTAASTTTAPACAPADVKVIAVTDALSYAAGVDPQLSLSITNVGPAACTFKDGSDQQKYVITSGSETIWSSKDCQTSAVSATSTLQPNIPVKSSPFAWNRTRSNPADCAATNPPQVIAGGASYHLTVTVNGVTSSKVNSPQFILK